MKAKAVRIKGTAGLESRIPNEVIDPLVNMLLGNTVQRIGTAQFKSKTIRKAFETPAFIGYCSGNGPTFNAYQVKEPTLNNNRMISFDHQLPRESFVSTKEGFHDAQHQ